MEYTQKEKNGRVIIITDIHNCHFEWHGISNDERMDLLCNDLADKYIEKPYDIILCLGDYSLDFWFYGGSFLQNPSVSNTSVFVQNIRRKFPVKTYMIAGNHEQYGNEKFKEITGYPRQFSVVYGDTIFAMCDTFAGILDPIEHGDGLYSGVDTQFIEDLLKRHNDKRIMLCMHDLQPEKESQKFKKLIQENNNIVCAFAGHTHKSEIIMVDFGGRSLPIIYCGNYSYNSESDKCNWGYGMLNFVNGFKYTYESNV